MTQENNSKLNDLAPVVLFAYNRPRHIRQTVEALQKNELASESELFIYSDGPKNENAVAKVAEVREYIKTIDGFKKITIIERDKNWGLANNIIDGVTKVVNEYGKIIVLEDDLLTSPYFLRFMNEALEMYRDELKVGSIHGHIYNIKYDFAETFFIPKTGCFGWATWKDRWDLFEHDARKLCNILSSRKLVNEFNNKGSYNHFKELERQANGDSTAWAARFNASLFLHNKLTLYPGKSFVKHIGLDGVHFNDFDKNDPKNGEIFDYKDFKLKRISIEINDDSYNGIISYYKSLKKPFYLRVFNKIKKIITKTMHVL
jgi:hypothetical protein